MILAPSGAFLNLGAASAAGAPSSGESAYWVQQATTKNITTILPRGMLETTEYLTLVVAREYMTFLRRQPTTTADSSASGWTSTEC